ncbi:MAG TPA: hypothetical protein PKY25_00140 [Bacilli bacterium]|nr:hypothetical protein [Bacilli bacterium]
MKKIRVLVIIFMLVCISGCTVKYNVTINKNGYVKEEIVATEFNTYLGENPSNSVSIDYKKYKSLAKFKNYSSESIKKSNETGMKLSNDYIDTCDYIENSLATRYVFLSMKCTETDKYYKIINDGDFLGGCFECNDEINNIDKLYITFSLPEKAIASNADKVVNNKYNWIINRNDTKDKSFMLKIEKHIPSENNNNAIMMYVLIGIVIIPALYYFIKIIVLAIKNRNSY